MNPHHRDSESCTGNGVSSMCPGRASLALFAFVGIDGHDLTARRVAEFASRSGAAVRIECVFDISFATVPVPGPHGMVHVFSPGSEATVNARRRAEVLRQRLVAICEETAVVQASSAMLTTPWRRLTSVAETVELIALSPEDFQYATQWHHARNPVDCVRKQNTAVLVVGGEAEPVATRTLLADVETTVAEPAPSLPGLIRAGTSTVVRASAHMTGAAPWTWQELEEAAVDHACGTVAVRVLRRWSVPIVGKNARLRKALRQTGLSVVLV